MDISPAQKWINYINDYCTKNGYFCDFDKANERVFYKDGEVEVWNEELYRGLTEMFERLKTEQVSPPEEIEEWFAYSVVEKGTVEVDYKFEILTKHFTFLFVVYEENERQHLVNLKIYVKGREDERYKIYSSSDYEKEIFIYLKTLSEEIKMVFLTRNSARLKHLLKQTRINEDAHFNDVYEKAIGVKKRPLSERENSDV